MRCLTLADALQQRGARVRFVSRHIPEFLRGRLAAKGYEYRQLDSSPNLEVADDVFHARWLGTTQLADAQDTIHALSDRTWDWLIVDHYALDARWETVLHRADRNIFVIDDLADRPHRCRLLLDQNLGRQPQEYESLVPADCQVLAGPAYALLRPEFAALRSYSLQRRQSQSTLRRLLITMGGVDQCNATGLALRSLNECTLPLGCRISVVMGQTAPWLQSVQELAAQMPWSTEVVVNVSDMAQRMANSDLAIGAAGSTSWERCCLGLPTVMVVLAENQQQGGQALDAANAAQLIGSLSEIATQLPLAIREISDSDCRIRMSRAASAITEGNGVNQILKIIGAVNA
jgi:UDP-2,4-diacetamido-2,4,6-trideoxy-beta-L-altropyranose hydrolase